MDNLFYCLRLIRSPGIGPITYFDLIKRYGSEKGVIEYLEREKKPLATLHSIEKEINATRALGAKLITYHDLLYPSLLKEIHDFPPVISLLGDEGLFHKPCVGIVGSRNASLNARSFTENLAKDLVYHGYTVVSGFARGIDGAAHKGALKTASDNPSTLAVVAGGIDVIYPPEHRDLYQQMTQKGAILSEMPLGLFPGAKHFPRRNRLISGLSKALCVIEAARPSGTLITAQYAMEHNRELFAVPGFPGDPRSLGCNALLRQGAYVLENVMDILHVLRSASDEKPISTLSSPSTFQKKQSPKSLYGEILNCLNTASISLETLLGELSSPPQAIHEALLELELQEKITLDRAGYIHLTLKK